MIDLFVLLAPALLLGVIALLGFVGCAQLAGVDDWEPGGTPAPPAEEPQPPTNLHSEAGDGVVTLLWDPIPDALLFEIFRKIAPPGMPPASWDPVADLYDTVTPAELTDQNGFVAYVDDDVTNGTTYHYVIRTVMGDGTSDFSASVEATPKTPFGPFVTSFVEGTPATVAVSTVWVGMAIQVGLQAMTVHKLGRASGLSLNDTHKVKVVDGETNADLGLTSVDMDSEPLDEFRYGPLTPAVVLNPGGIYYVVSEETVGGDSYWDQDTIVETNAEATVTSAVYSDNPGLFTTVGAENHSYGPVNFQY